MIIGVDAREICDRPAGKGQYLLRVLWQWQQDSDIQLVLYIYDHQELPESIDHDRVTVYKQPGKGLLWHRSVGKRLKSDGVEVFFAALSYQSALWNKVPTVTVVHDLAIFRLSGFSHNRKAQIVERLTLKRCIKRSAHLVAVSQSTKKDLLEIMSAPEKKISVIYESSLLGEDSVANPLPFKDRQSFFLFTGTLEPRKNIAAILRAFADLPEPLREKYRLKFAGKPGWGGEDYPALAHELGIADQVDFLGYVSDEDLRTLFKDATLFLFPSFYEGFGLPVIEAMSYGTPVITSSTSSLPEVVGEKGYVVSPDDYGQLSSHMQGLLGSQAAFNEYSQYLFNRSKEFRWDAIAQEIANLCRISR